MLLDQHAIHRNVPTAGPHACSLADQVGQLIFAAALKHADDVGWEMEEGSICGLGMVAAKPLESARQYFPEAFAEREDR